MSLEAMQQLAGRITAQSGGVFNPLEVLNPLKVKVPGMPTVGDAVLYFQDNAKIGDSSNRSLVDTNLPKVNALETVLGITPQMKAEDVRRDRERAQKIDKATRQTAGQARLYGVPLTTTYNKPGQKDPQKIYRDSDDISEELDSLRPSINALTVIDPTSPTGEKITVDISEIGLETLRGQKPATIRSKAQDFVRLKAATQRAQELGTPLDGIDMSAPSAITEISKRNQNRANEVAAEKEISTTRATSEATFGKPDESGKYPNATPEGRMKLDQNDRQNTQTNNDTRMTNSNIATNLQTIAASKAATKLAEIQARNQQALAEYELRANRYENDMNRKETALDRSSRAEENAMRMELEYARLSQEAREDKQARKDKMMMMMLQGLGNLGQAFTI